MRMRATWYRCLQPITPLSLIVITQAEWNNTFKTAAALAEQRAHTARRAHFFRSRLAAALRESLTIHSLTHSLAHSLAHSAGQAVAHSAGHTTGRVVPSLPASAGATGHAAGATGHAAGATGHAAGATGHVGGSHLSAVSPRARHAYLSAKEEGVWIGGRLGGGEGVYM